MMGNALRVVSVLLTTLGVVACQAAPPPVSGAASPTSAGASATAAQSPTRGGTLVVALEADPPTLNPITSQITQTFYVANQIYDTLVTYDKDFNLVPRLATSWTIAPDAKTYTFKLASGVKWHDGQPFTSDDVKFSFEVLQKQYSAIAASVLGSLQSVDAPDPQTTVLHFSQPAAVLASSLGDPALAILPKHLYSSGDARQNPANLAPVGTGPFKFKEWTRGDHITLVRNDSYFQPGLPYLDQLVVRIVPDTASQVAALRRGEAQLVIARVSAADAQALKKEDGIQVVSPSVAARIGGLWPNLRKAPTNNLQVRKALSLATDRARMVEQVAFGQATPARGPLGSRSVYFDKSLPALNRDVAAANKLLDDAGFKKGADGSRFTVRILTQSQIPEFVKSVQIIKENYDEIGVKVDIVAGESATINDAVFNKFDFDLSYYTQSMGPEPAVRFNDLYTTQAIGKGFFTNAPGYSNPAVDQMAKDATLTVDKAARTQLYYKLQQAIMADLPVIPTWEPLLNTAYRTTFANLLEQPDDRYIWLGAAYQVKK